MNALIKASHLQKTYQKRTVVKNSTFQINQGETIALIGPNGAGKTTTIGMLLGIIKPDSGELSYWTTNFKSKMGVQLQSTPFFEGYTVEENIRLFAAFYNVKVTKSELNNVLETFGLLEVEKSPAVKLSLGQQKRLAIAVTTIHHPDLVILDEPSAGLDPRGQKEIRNLILQLKEKGVTILFSSHDMLEVTKIADRIMIMSKGEIATNGSPKELIEKYELTNLEELFYKLTE